MEGLPNKLFGPEAPENVLDQMKSDALEGLRQFKQTDSDEAIESFRDWNKEKELSIDLRDEGLGERSNLMLERTGLYILAGLRNEALTELERARYDAGTQNLSGISSRVDALWETASAMPEEGEWHSPLEEAPYPQE